MLSLNNLIAKSENSIESEIDGDVVLMNLDKNEYYSMDTVGSFIWKMIETPVTIKEITSKLVELYEVGIERCESSTLHFLNELYERNIIELNN